MAPVSLWIGLFETTDRGNFSIYASSDYCYNYLPFSWRPILEPTRADKKILPPFLVQKTKKSSEGDHKTLGLEFTNRLSGHPVPWRRNCGILEIHAFPPPRRGLLRFLTNDVPQADVHVG
jgi:hypothetical protein